MQKKTGPARQLSHQQWLAMARAGVLRAIRAGDTEDHNAPRPEPVDEDLPKFV